MSQRIFVITRQTAVNNVFQNKVEQSNLQVQNAASFEFTNMVEALKNVNIEVLILPSPTSHTPDAVFPNNWFSTHVLGGKNYIYIYPMYSENRQAEVQVDKLYKLLTQSKSKSYEVVDFREQQKEPKRPVALEGTGVFIFDYSSKTAFLSISERASQALAQQVTERMGYELIVFSSVDEKAHPIYHTNVMMSIGDKLALVCLESIKSKAERQMVQEKLAKIGKAVIGLSYEQIKNMAANVLEVKNKEGHHFLLMSQTANSALTAEQKLTIDKYCERLAVPIPTIEKVGGGSVRCMMAEIF